MSSDARIAVGLPTHPKTKKLIKRLGQSAAWNLVCLILWTAANRSDGRLDGMSVEDIELAADWLGDDGAFVGALVETEILVSDKLFAGLWKPGKESIGRICSKTWRRVRLAIFERDGWACVYCGATDAPLECDHIHPVSRGGSNEDSNLATACLPCNRSKKDKTVEEWRLVA